MRLLALALLTVAGTALAAGGSVSTLAEPDPARAAAAVDQGWLAFSAPVRPGTRSPCCWQGQWNRPMTMECRLQDEQHTHGTRDDSPLTGSVTLFAQLREGQVRQLLLAGEDCPVNAAGAQVTELAAVDETAAVDWLEALARSGGDDLGHQALHALSLLAGDAASVRIKRMARTEPDPELRGTALFLLAESNPQQAKPLLREVLDGKPDRELSEHALFAVTQLGDGSGDELLFEIARDPGRPDEQRRQAFFWLTQSNNEATLDRLTALLTANP